MPPAAIGPMLASVKELVESHATALESLRSTLARIDERMVEQAVTLQQLQSKINDLQQLLVQAVDEIRFLKSQGGGGTSDADLDQVGAQLDQATAELRAELGTGGTQQPQGQPFAPQAAAGGMGGQATFQHGPQPQPQGATVPQAGGQGTALDQARQLLTARAGQQPQGQQPQGQQPQGQQPQGQPRRR